jgi:hypothetical protein
MEGQVNRLTLGSLSSFRQRFSTFHDSLLTKLECYPISRRSEQILVTVCARDWTIESTEQWVNITFDFQEVQQFIVKRMHNYSLGVIFSAGIDFYDDEIYVDFRSMSTEGAGKTHYNIERANKESTAFLVIAKKCYWWVEPYQKLYGAVTTE